MDVRLLPLIVSALAVLSYYGFRAIISLWWKPRLIERQLRQQGIRGNSYQLIYGDMKDEMKVIQEAWSSPMEISHRITPRVVPFAHQMVQKYGKICFMWVGSTARLIIWDPELMKVVFNDKLDQFQKPPVNPQIKILAEGLSSLEGEIWAKRRRTISPAFHLEKIKGMVPAFLASCVDLVKRWEALVSEEGSCELDVWPEFQNLTGDIISRAAFGSSFEEGKTIFQLQKEQAALVIEAARAPYIPGFRYLPTAKNKKRVHVDNEIKSMLRYLIKKKRIAMETQESASDDLLALMLESDDLSEAEVIEECKLFYFAGQETTSSWLTWTFVLLAMHPTWQQKAREEVLKKCGKNTPDFDSLGSLKTVSMILQEVLRLYPSVVSLYRQTQKLTKLGDFSLPAEVDILLPTILIHHDPQIWGEDAGEFNPERFSQGISKASIGNAYFPFGWGPRMCLGQSFAMIEARLAVAIILQHFSFELSPSYAHAPYTVITLQPQLGAHLIIHQL